MEEKGTHNSNILEMQEEKQLPLQVFENLFHNLDTYAVLPVMFDKVAHDVVRSEFDSIKEHTICYHIAGITNTILAARDALKLLNIECKILDINLENEMDKEDISKFKHILKALEEIE